MADPESDTSGIVDLLERGLDDVDPIVAAVGRDAYRRPTPCPEFDVRTLLAHLIGGLISFAIVGEGGPLDFAVDPDLDGKDALTEYRAAGARLVAAWRRPGALDGAYAMPWGESAGRQLAGFSLIEILTHGWDLARACAISRPIDAELAEIALDSARQWVDESARVPPLFGPEVAVADDAPAGDRLAAFLGRRV